MSRFDRFALVQGVLAALMVVVPAVALNGFLTRGERESSLSFPLFVVAFAGWVLGAGVAAWVQQRDTPYTHGIVAAVIAYVVPQTALVVVNLLADDSVAWLRIAFSLTFVVFAGSLGGIFGERLQRRGVLPSVRRGGDAR